MKEASYLRKKGLLTRNNPVINVRNSSRFHLNITYQDDKVRCDLIIIIIIIVTLISRLESWPSEDVKVKASQHKFFHCSTTSKYPATVALYPLIRPTKLLQQLPCITSFSKHHHQTYPHAISNQKTVELTLFSSSPNCSLQEKHGAQQNEKCMAMDDEPIQFLMPWMREVTW